MPGRAGAAVGGGGAQHTPLRCPGLCRTSPRGESSLSGQPPVLVASACLGLSGLRPLSSVSALCFPRPPPGSQSLISLLSPHRRVRPCPAPAAWCPCFSSQRGAPGSREASGFSVQADVRRRGRAGLLGPAGLCAGPGGCRLRGIALCCSTAAPARRPLQPRPLSCLPLAAAAPTVRAMQDPVRQPPPWSGAAQGGGWAWQPAERVPSGLRAAGLSGGGREWDPRTPPSA